MKFVKSLILYFYFKFHRIIYLFKYKIPFHNKKVDNTRLVNINTCLDNIKSVAIIGKGASIFQSNPLQLINECDFKFLMNSVDIDYLEKYIGKKFDAQLCTHVGPVNSIIPVLSKLQIKRTEIKILICNNTLNHENGKTILNFWNFFNNRVKKIAYMPDQEDFTFNLNLKKYGDRLSMASSLCMLLYNVKSLEKIVFVGVDAFHFGYSYRPGVSKKDRHFYPFEEGGYTDPKVTHGLPFLNFLFDSLKIINNKRKVVAFFPKILKKYINFPTANYIEFYN